MHRGRQKLAVLVDYLPFPEGSPNKKDLRIYRFRPAAIPNTREASRDAADEAVPKFCVCSRGIKLQAGRRPRRRGAQFIGDWFL